MRHNLIKATTITVVTGIATCLHPAIAQAQQAIPEIPLFDTPLLQFSGFSDLNSEVTVTFSLNPSVEDINSLESVGEFPRAVQNFTTSGNQETGLSPLSFDYGTVRTSRLTSDSTTGAFPGVNLNNDGLRYDVTFENGSETLTLFIPSNDSSLINSLSGLSEESDGIQGVVTYSDGRLATIVSTNIPGRQAFTVTTVSVPESTATAGLVGLGALGAVSVLKRNKRLSKSAEINCQ
ncbi:MAG: hypothetical protein SAK29_28750 [Scytonema sp. PMC 1069.18]|nr:hypothetical protein [Scytonema sp. PMC 1069.18]MEC4886612.1 hypothetical protein [Scytonema sp. PMC 1070.18]